MVVKFLYANLVIACSVGFIAVGFHGCSNKGGGGNDGGEGTSGASLKAETSQHLGEVKQFQCDPKKAGSDCIQVNYAIPYDEFATAIGNDRPEGWRRNLII